MRCPINIYGAQVRSYGPGTNFRSRTPDVPAGIDALPICIITVRLIANRLAVSSKDWGSGRSGIDSLSSSDVSKLRCLMALDNFLRRMSAGQSREVESRYSVRPLVIRKSTVMEEIFQCQ